MTSRKLLLASVGATVLLGMLVGSTSARNFSASSQLFRASFARLDFSGGFGTVECEVVLEASWHSRTMAKVARTLVGYITAGNVTRCIRGGGTILRETLPWHIRYGSFAGTLPNILTIAFNTDTRFKIREPAFGITCLYASTPEQQAGLILSVGAGGVITSAARTGSLPSSCGAAATISGTTTNVDNRAGARITVTLI